MRLWSHVRSQLMMPCYFFSLTFFFLVGGLLAMALRFELLTPGSDLMAPIPSPPPKPMTTHPSTTRSRWKP